jgi:hypothetical protein
MLILIALARRCDEISEVVVVVFGVDVADGRGCFAGIQ